MKSVIPQEVTQYQAAYFETFGTLPTPVIECNITGQAVTCFGTNLAKKVEMAGSIEKLLETFVGRGNAPMLAKPAKPAKTPAKPVKAPSKAPSKPAKKTPKGKVVATLSEAKVGDLVTLE
jgi:hypothetical protein